MFTIIFLVFALVVAFLPVVIRAAKFVYRNVVLVWFTEVVKALKE